MFVHRRYVMTTDVREIPWTHDFDTALNKAQVEHKSALLDFTAAPM